MGKDEWKKRTGQNVLNAGERVVGDVCRDALHRNESGVEKLNKSMNK